MLKMGIFLLFLAAPELRYDVVGELINRGRSRFASVRMESVDGLSSRQTLAGFDGRFTLSKVPPGQYFVTVRLGRSREVRQTIEVAPEFADKKKRIAFKVDVQKAIVLQSTQKANLTALLVPDKARAELRKSLAARADVEKARRHLEAALEIAPNFEEALNNLGTIYYRKGDHARALELFERALKSNSESFVARVNLGGVLLTTAQFDRALVENQKAAALRPRDSLARSQLGMSYFYLRQYEAAIPHLQAAKEADEFSPALPGLFLAMSQESLGNIAAAVSEYEEFVKRHPRHGSAPGIKRRLADLKQVKQ